MSIDQKWKLISDELLAAFNLLPSRVNESDFGYSKEDFLQYLSVNELRLAMEELDGVMENNTSPGQLFWEHMNKAASLMNKPKHIEKYEKFKTTT
jgi:ribosomal protein S18 acetylase RimI-like enzyme